MSGAGDIVLCAPLRTPVGRFGGMFRGIDAPTLASSVIRAIVASAELDPANVDEIILGQASPNGEAPAIGRVTALEAGLGFHVTGRQVDRRCGSGLQAIIDAAMQVKTGGASLLLAGGVESMSQAEHYLPAIRWGGSGEIALRDRLERARITAGGRGHLIAGGTLETAENLRLRYNITREAQDQMALLSHQKAVAAQNSGAFAAEIVPVALPNRKGSQLADKDEHPRSDTTLSALGLLKPVRLRQDPTATVTAGNSSGQNDGAALAIVTTAHRATELGLRPMAYMRGWAAAGVEPEYMGIAAAPAAAKALQRCGLTLADMGIIELNEAFAAQALAVLSEWDITMDDPRLNPHGSGISLGHPVGATGARLVTTLLHGMLRGGHRYGLVTMCIAGGQGLAAVFEAAA